MYHELGDFAEGEYSFEVRRSSRSVKLAMKRDGHVDGSKVTVIKEITLPRAGSVITVDYRIINNGAGTLNAVFGPEINLTMPNADSTKCSIVFNGENKKYGLSETLQRNKIEALEMRDKLCGFSLKISVSDPCRIWHFPIRTVSQSEKAYELNYQGSALFPALELELGVGEEKRVGFTIELIEAGK